MVLDADGDGCTDDQEAYGASAPAPGSTCSSPSSCYSDSAWWDFYDVPTPAYGDPTPNGSRNRTIGMDDVLAVLIYVGAREDDVPNGNGVDYDSDKNGDTVKDGRDYDRSPSLLPNPPSEAGPPSGAVGLEDLLSVLAQVGLGCAP